MAAAAASDTNLHTLPALPLEEIASSLGFEDQVNLAASHPNLGFLAPREQIVQGEDFHESGPFPWEGPWDGDFCPETYMDVPVLTRGLVSVKMSFRWKDQGYGNRKGNIWLRLIRSSEVIADSRVACITIEGYFLARSRRQSGGGTVGCSRSFHLMDGLRLLAENNPLLRSIQGGVPHAGPARDGIRGGGGVLARRRDYGKEGGRPAGDAQRRRGRGAQAHGQRLHHEDRPQERHLIMHQTDHSCTA